MNEAHQDLWRRLEALELDDPAASLTFTRRLARENGWDHAFARRVVDEYKRFVFLAMTAGHEVTPSDEVDQAWHLHLTYTRSYWGELCGEVLGRPLHHGPTKGGKSEGDRFEDQYERTLASYREAFGSEPPSDVWPPSAVRFGEAPDFVRVNRQRTWLLPKPWKLGDKRPLALAGAWICLAPPLAAGAAWNPLDFDGPTFLSFYAVVAVIAVVGSMVCRLVLRAPGPRSGIAQIATDSPIEIGALRAGWRGAFHVAMANLLAGGALTHLTKRSGWVGVEHRFLAQRGPEPSDGEIEQAILSRAEQNKDGLELQELGSAAEPIAKQVEATLVEKGFLETDSSFQAVRLAVGALMGSTFALGIVKLVVGLNREKPVGFLVVGLVVLSILTLLLIKRPHQTRTGKATMTQLKLSQTSLAMRASKPTEDLTGAEAALAVALLGVVGCSALSNSGLRDAVQATSPSSGGCGSGDGGCGGGGDGGGGCGGGCGGCGGCGG